MKIKEKRGITLIALVITIVILIILATVTLNVVLGEGGLIDRAKLAKDLTEQAALEEQQGLNNLMSEYANIMAEDQTPLEPPTPIEEAKPNPDEDGKEFIDTTKIEDEQGNIIVLPGGFHLDKDSGTSVEEGIVIEDTDGNQFVWIPTGTYKTSNGEKTNNLTRREWPDENVVAEPIEVDKNEPVSSVGNISDMYGEENENSCTITDGVNSIYAFLKSAESTSNGGNGGFYIGRYEQGVGNVCKDGVSTYSGTRDKSKVQAEAMYEGNTFVKSELISSYAWDTALNFMCQTNEEGYALATNTTKTTEEALDDYTNIHGLLKGAWEWTTEYCDDDTFLAVYRGGYKNYGTTYDYAASRFSDYADLSSRPTV